MFLCNVRDKCFMGYDELKVTKVPRTKVRRYEGTKEKKYAWIGFPSRQPKPQGAFRDRP